jgi:hypothetical protein
VLDDRDKQMMDLEAIRMVYELAIKAIRGPVTDEQLDALFKVREMVMGKIEGARG